MYLARAAVKTARWRTRSPAAAGGGSLSNVRSASPLSLNSQARRDLHETPRQDAGIIVGGLGVAALATGVRYVLRAGRRMREMEEAERRGEGRDGGGGGGGSSGSDEGNGGKRGSSTSAPASAALVGPAFGVDFGTTSLRLASSNAAGKAPEVVENREGHRWTPAALAFRGGDAPIVGSLAAVHRWQTPASTLVNLQPLLGLPFADPLVSWLAGTVGYGLVDGGDCVAVEAVWAGANALPLPVDEAAVMLLRALADLRDHKLGGSAGATVLTRPVHFSASQAAALEAAGTAAGLCIITSVPDALAAVAAASELGLLTPPGGEGSSSSSGGGGSSGRLVAVVDIGGRAAQCTIVDTAGADASSGDFGFGGLAGAVVGHAWAPEAGGEAMVEALVALLDENFLRANRDMSSLLADGLALPRLHEAAQAAMLDLSQKASTDVNIPFITADRMGPKHVDCAVTRAQFERVADAVLFASAAPVGEALAAAGVAAGNVGAVLVVGGCSRLPAVQEAAAKAFGRRPVVPVHSEEMAVLGAAIAARRAIYGS
ncbi:unnamed protein product [Phaeothamnion confervicola]